MPGMNKPPPPRPGVSPMPPAKVPQPDQRLGTYKTQMYTFFTQPNKTVVLYSADKPWQKLQVMLETAGPVVIGESQDLSPVTSGKGRSLITNVPLEVDIPMGNRIYILSSAVNRVAVTVTPIPWGEQILGGIVRAYQLITGALAALSGKGG